MRRLGLTPRDKHKQIIDVAQHSLKKALGKSCTSFHPRAATKISPGKHTKNKDMQEYKQKKLG
jgi:hypothetical protein